MDMIKMLCHIDFLTEMSVFDKKSLKYDGILPQLASGEKPLIGVVHNECTDYANCD